MKHQHLAPTGIALGAMLAAVAGGRADAALTVTGQFSPGLGTLVSCATDPAAGRVYIYGDFGAVISVHATDGTLVTTFPRPGESANDADLEVAPEELTLGTTTVPAGTLLFINGESGPAEIYAINPDSGRVLATLQTQFGVSHVVGGGYHACRNTFFLVQDNVPVVAERNRIAEINPVTGAVLNTYQIGANFNVSFGDLDVNNSSGNLTVVSSAETGIAEFTPVGGFLGETALPAGVSSLSGIGIDEATGEAWVSGTSGGTVWKLAGVPTCDIADINCDTVVNIDDLLSVVAGWGPCPALPGVCTNDVDCNAVVNIDDLLLVISSWG